MSTKHTPGPWVRLRGSYATSIVDSEHRPICVVYKQGDALLIEAAPDLLKASKRVVELIETIEEDRASPNMATDLAERRQFAEEMASLILHNTKKLEAAVADLAAAIAKAEDRS